MVETFFKTIKSELVWRTVRKPTRGQGPGMVWENPLRTEAEGKGLRQSEEQNTMDMSTTTNAVYVSMNGLADLLEGPENAGKTRVAYHGFIGDNVRAFEFACRATADFGFDTVIGVLDPADVEGGVRKVGVAFDLGDTIRLQFGQLWMSPKGDRAVLVPRGSGKRYGHFAFEDGRFVHRRGWPAQDLARGTERAELTIKHALAEAA